MKQLTDTQILNWLEDQVSMGWGSHPVQGRPVSLVASVVFYKQYNNQELWEAGPENPSISLRDAVCRVVADEEGAEPCSG